MNPEHKGRPPEPIPVEEIPSGLLEKIATHPPWWEDKDLVADVRRLASDPAVRAAVRDFCIRYCSGHYRNIAAWARDLVGLTQADFASPDVRRNIHGMIEYTCKQGEFTAVRFLTDLDPSGLDFFKSMGGMMAIESGLKMIALNSHYGIPLKARVQSLLDLASMNIPDVFQRHGIRKAVVDVQAMILRDRKFSFLDELSAAGIQTDMTDPHLRSAVEFNAHESAKAGKTDEYCQYRDRFGLSPAVVSLEDVTEGYETLLGRNAPPAEAQKFVDAFPQFASAIASYESVSRVFQPKVGLGLPNLIEAGNIPAAQRLAASEGLSPAQFDEQVRMSIGNLLNRFGGGNVERIFLRIRHELGIPESTFQEEGEALIRANASPFPKNIRISWDVARRIRRLSGLPEDRFEEAYAAGQVDLIRGLDLQKNESLSAMQDLPKRIRSYREMPGMNGSFADRLEKRLGSAYLVKMFGTPRYCRSRSNDLPHFIDRATVRPAAVEGLQEALANPKEIASVPEINKFLVSVGIEPLAWAEMRTGVMEAAKRELLTWNPYVFSAIVDALHAPDEDVQLILDATRDDVREEMLVNVKDARRREILFRLYGFTWETFPLQDIPLKELLETKNPVLVERAKGDPWRPSFEALLKMQARSANEGHDPWTTDFFPLVDRVGKRNGGLDRNSEKDGALLVDYVATFGMMNLQNVSRVYFRLKKGPFASLPESDRQIVTELVGPKAARMESENLINELRLLRISLQRDLLADIVPRKIGTTLGEEMFLVLRGSTQWEKNDRPSEIFATWKRTVDTTKTLIVRHEQNAIAAIASHKEETATWLYAEADALREKISVAPGYEESSFAVAKRVRGEAKAGPEEKEIERLLAPFDETGAVNPLRHVFDLYTYDVADTVRTRKRLSRHYAWEDIGTGLDSEFDELALDWAGIDSLSPVEFDKRVVAHLEAIAAAEGRNDALDKYLLELSAAHLAGIAPEAWTNVLTDAGGLLKTEDAVQSLASFMTQYLKEHYLNPAQNPDHTGHTPFSEPLRLALGRVWKAEGDASENVLLRANARIAELRRSQTRLSRDTVEIALVPVHGPLRIYAGDIGDACYTSQHDEMARGAYPRLKAMIFVTNRNKQKERMAGSVLFVETRVAETSERIVVIRANNPRQNLVAQLDAPSLVQQTIDAAIETAKRRRIRHVGIVLDEATHASSNREEVSAAYANEYGGSDTVGLVNEPETNFNGYEIWDAKGEDPTVIVWTNDDPEAT